MLGVVRSRVACAASAWARQASLLRSRGPASSQLQLARAPAAARLSVASTTGASFVALRKAPPAAIAAAFPSDDALHAGRRYGGGTLSGATIAGTSGRQPTHAISRSWPKVRPGDAALGNAGTVPALVRGTHAAFSSAAARAFSAAAGPRSTDDRSDTSESPQRESAALKVLRKLHMHPDQLVAPDGFNRWRVAPAAMANHLCLGSVFAWSIFNQPLTRLHGAIAPAAADWTLGDVSLTFSLVMGGFLWGALLGKVLDAWGPRASCLVGAASLGAGFGLGALAIQMHSLPLLYVGGAVWGLANGWAYVPPVATLMKWFPDRKGFASGATIMGYGGGAMIAAPLFTKLLEHFRVAPTYLGNAVDVALQNEGGKLFANDSAGNLVEVIVATATDAATFGLGEGVYVVGSGSTGAAETFMTLGAGYASLMALAALAYRVPQDGYVPDSVKAAQAAAAAGQQGDNPPKKDTSVTLTTHNVSVPDATRSPQFWLMYAGFGLSITGSYGIISSGKTLLSEAFGSAMPDVVTAGFSATFVAAMSAANMGGRVFWSNMSDFVGRKIGGDPFRGRKLIYSAMWGIGPPLYVGVVWAIHQAAESPGMLPLGVFCGSVFLILASFGGSAATRPALTGDLFGTRNVTVMTARQLSVVMPAAFLGPRIATTLREWSIHDALEELTRKVDDSVFEAAFGAGRDQLALLAEQKTVTINRLMELVPAGTVDPTPFVYDQTMYVMAGLQAMAFLSNQLLKPVDKSLHEHETKPAAKGQGTVQQSK